MAQVRVGPEDGDELLPAEGAAVPLPDVLQVAAQDLRARGF